MGLRSEYVVSGSDDGRIFIWCTRSGALVNVLAGEQGASCVQVGARAPARHGWVGGHAAGGGSEAAPRLCLAGS